MDVNFNSNVVGGYDDITPQQTDKTVFSREEIETLDTFKDIKTPLAIFKKIDPDPYAKYVKVKTSMERMPGSDMSDKRTDQLHMQKFKKPGCPEMYCAVVTFEAEKEDGTIIKFEKMIYTNVLVLEDADDENIAAMQLQKAIAGITAYSKLNFEKPLNPKSSQFLQQEEIANTSRITFQYVTNRKGTKIEEVIRQRYIGNNSAIEAKKMSMSRNIYSIIDLFKGVSALSKKDRKRNIKEVMNKKIETRDQTFKNNLKTNFYSKGKVSISDLGVNEALLKGFESEKGEKLKDLESLHEHIDTYNNTQVDINSKEETIAESRKEIKNMKAEIKTLEEEIESIPSQLESLGHQINEKINLRNDEEENEELDNEIAELEHQVTNLEAKLEGEGSLQVKIEQLKVDIEEAKTSSNNLKTDIQADKMILEMQEEEIIHYTKNCYELEKSIRLNNLENNDSKYQELMGKINKVGSEFNAYLDAHYRVFVSPDLVEVPID